jgi:serine/threonine protein kinase/Tol biopolymer transport system component
MPEIGQNLSHYSIVEKIGKGGMGEVYRAKDQKLGRDVAIKVLPEEFARDMDRVARFQREAKLLASLNHPNIAAIYGLEESGGTNFLVLELVEGDTLADRIKGGAIPVEESLKLALQIAEALEAAHEKGVIHRDLKPANIKVTPDGKVKVLDFGLAKAYAGDQEVNLSNSPTLSDMATQQGVILGTAAYMSPEQAKGKAVDKRTDIWAFGCVLCEMLTGQAAFQGEDVTEILAAVVKLGPNLDFLPANIHPRVREVITRCLQKEQKKRYGGIGEAHYEIEKVLSDPNGVFAQPIAATEPRTRLRTLLAWAAASLVLGLIIAGVAVWSLRKPEPKRVMRFEYDLQESRQFSQNDFGQIPLAVSPDGTHFVYGANGGLHLRSMNQLDAKLIAGTEGAEHPFFSPDGQWIGYHSDAEAKLKKVAISGGVPVTLCNTSFLGGMWNKDNTIIYSNVEKGIMRVSADGGSPEMLIKRRSDEFFDAPQFLPDGKAVLFLEVAQEEPKILVQSLESGEAKKLFGGEDFRYLPTGHIVYLLGGNLFAIPFDPERLRVTGGPVSMIEGVRQFSVSDDGALIFIPGTPSAGIPKLSLVWVDRKGREAPFAEIESPWLSLSLSPDGTRLALGIENKGGEDIWIRDLLRETMTRLTFDEADDYTPIWTPDSKRIVYTSQQGLKWMVRWKAADGAGEAEQLALVPDREIWPWSWSGDGKTLLLTELAPETHADIGTLSIEGDRARKALLSEKYYEADPKISPNGRWMAYTSNESRQNEIYVRPFPEIKKGKWQVSTNGGHSPLWSPDGRELFYRNDDATMRVAVETQTTFKPGKPEVLFRGKYYYHMPSGIEFTPWDISRDGKRFVMAKRAQPADSGSAEKPLNKINIVLNWFEELKQRVPVK